MSRPSAFRALLAKVRGRLGETALRGRIASRTGSNMTEALPTDLADWLSGHPQGALTLHDTRGHMPSDLARYLFAACHAQVEGASPRAHAFPEALAPDHRSWTSGKFNDRFRVQLAHQPSTTITSHIAKDGHYFIHPDPFQCRSLTVREAARLQTFPDDWESHATVCPGGQCRPSLAGAPDRKVSSSCIRPNLTLPQVRVHSA